MNRFFNFLLFLCISLASFGQSAESDSLFAVGVSLYEQGRYEESIEVFKGVEHLDSIWFKSGENPMATLKTAQTFAPHWRASALYKLGRIDEARKLARFDYASPPVDRKGTGTLCQYSDMVVDAMNSGSNAMTLMYADWVIEEETRLFGANSWFLANSYLSKANLLSQEGKYREAEISALKAASIFKACNLSTEIIEPTRLHYRASAEMQEGRYKEAYVLARQAYNAFRKIITLDPGGYNTASQLYLLLTTSQGTALEFGQTCIDISSDFMALEEITEENIYSVWGAVSSLVEQKLSDVALRTYDLVSKRVEDSGLGSTLAAAYLRVAYARCFNEQSEFEKALALSNKAIEIVGSLKVPDAVSLGQMYFSKAAALSGLMRYPEVMEAADMAVAEFEKLLPYVDTSLSRTHILRAGALTQMKRYKEALEATSLIMKYMKNIGSKNWADYAYVKSQEGTIYSNMVSTPENRKAGKKAFQDAFEYYGRLGDVESIWDYYIVKLNYLSSGLLNREETDAIYEELNARIAKGDTLGNVLAPQIEAQYAPYLFFCGRTEESRRVYEGLKSKVPHLGDGTVVYARVLLRAGETAKAVEEVEKYIAILDEQYAERKLYIASALTLVADAFMGELPDKSMQYADRAVELLKSEDWTLQKVSLLMNLCNVYSTFGDPQTVLEIADEALKHADADNVMTVANLEIIRSSCQVMLADNEQARESLENARKILKKGGHEPAEIVEFLNAEIIVLEAEGRIADAIELAQKADAMLVVNQDMPQIAQRRLILGMRLLNLAQKSGNQQLYNETANSLVEMMTKSYSEDNPQFAIIYTRQAAILAMDGKIDEGRKLLTDALDRYKKYSDKRVELSIRQWIVSYDISAGSHTMALENGDSIIYLCEKLGIRPGISLPIMLARSANFIGEYDRAIEYLNLIGKPQFGEITDLYTEALVKALFAEAYIGLQEFDQGYKYLSETTEMVRNNVLENFLTMTEGERRNFWNSMMVIFRANVPYSAQLTGFQSRYNELAYDAALFSTSLLLQSEKTIDDVVAEEKDRKVKKLAKELKIISTRYDALAEKAKTAEIADADLVALRKEKEKAEKELLKSLRAKLGNYNAGLVTKWQQVRDALQPDEAAVEFVELTMNDTTRVYQALVLRPGFESPHMMLLPLASIVDYRDESRYSDSLVYENLWKPLASELSGCRRVWFAPQGQLTAAAIESVPGVDRITGHPDALFCRLTSTREIVNRRREHGNGAVLFGGIDYGAGKDKLIEEQKNYPGAENRRSRSLFYESIDTRALTDDRALSADSVRDVMVGIKPLPGTMREILALQPILKSSGLLNKGGIIMRHDEKASEAAFKSYSGQHKRLLHIGTHGFYYTGTQTQFNRYFRDANSSERTPEELAMERSGLLFAGAQGPLCRGVKLPEGVDDGVLTAAEISALDFSGLELTVLSACETALGKISADGVFGLQRGFKKAGAGAMLMSLWKVDDDATAHLMKEFYRHWLSGDSANKYSALEKAKASVRTNPEHKEWANPEYWAAFILIDGI